MLNKDCVHEWRICHKYDYSGMRSEMMGVFYCIKCLDMIEKELVGEGIEE